MSPSPPASKSGSSRPRSAAQQAATAKFVKAGQAAAAAKRRRFGDSPAQVAAARHALAIARQDRRRKAEGKPPVKRAPTASPGLPACSARAVCAALGVPELAEEAHWLAGGTAELGAHLSAVAALFGCELRPGPLRPGALLVWHAWTPEEAHAACWPGGFEPLAWPDEILSLEGLRAPSCGIQLQM